MAPFALLRIDHVVLRIADLTRSLAFYVEALGCAVEKRRDDIGLFHLRAGASQIDLVLIDGPRGRMGGNDGATGGRNVDHFALQVAPFDEDAIRAHLAHYRIPAGPTLRRFGAQGYGPSLYITDPDGNTVELKGPVESSPPGDLEPAAGKL